MHRNRRASVNLFSSLVLSCLLGGGLMLSGCCGQQVAAPQPVATCNEVLAADLYSVSDFEIARLLDEAVKDKNCDRCRSECWEPLIKRALTEGRHLSTDHLKAAVRHFNHNQDAETFHLAIAAYFRALDQGESDYRPVDRQLLRSYCSLVLAESVSSSDLRLQRTMSLCRRLDPQLYGRIFQ